MSGKIIVNPGTIFDIDLVKLLHNGIKAGLRAGMPIPYDKIDPNIYIDIGSKNYYAITTLTNENGYRFQIGFSQRAFKEYGYNVDAYVNLMMHEIIHTCPKCFSHGKRWKYWVNYMNENYDYKINPKPYGKDTYDTCGLY